MVEKHTKKRVGKSTGRKSKWARRSARKDLEAFACSVFTWFEVAPQRGEDEWIEQPVGLRVYYRRSHRLRRGKASLNSQRLPAKDRPPRWILPTNAARAFVMQSVYPIELLAVVAWDLIKTLPIHKGRLHGNRKAYPSLRTKEAGKRFLKLIRSGSKTALDHLAQSYGYIDADDERMPLASRKNLPRATKVRRGNRAKTLAERRKPITAGRRRWPKPPRELLNMTPRMMSYWRAHKCYGEARLAFVTALPVFQDPKKPVRDDAE